MSRSAPPASQRDLTRLADALALLLASWWRRHDPERLWELGETRNDAEEDAAAA